MTIIIVKMNDISICGQCGLVKTEVRSPDGTRYRCRPCLTRAQRKSRREQQETPRGGMDVYWACRKWLKDRCLDD